MTTPAVADVACRVGTTHDRDGAGYAHRLEDPTMALYYCTDESRGKSCPHCHSNTSSRAAIRTRCVGSTSISSRSTRVPENRASANHTMRERVIHIDAEAAAIRWLLRSHGGTGIAVDYDDDT
jgi:hypothetical protein